MLGTTAWGNQIYNRHCATTLVTLNFMGTTFKNVKHIGYVGATRWHDGNAAWPGQKALGDLSGRAAKNRVQLMLHICMTMTSMTVTTSTWSTHRDRYLAAPHAETAPWHPSVERGVTRAEFLHRCPWSHLWGRHDGTSYQFSTTILLAELQLSDGYALVWVDSWVSVCFDLFCQLCRKPVGVHHCAGGL